MKIGSIDTDLRPGRAADDRRQHDLAINGDGFFVLRAPNANGAPVYTRNGDFSLNANGLLYDQLDGLAVQGYLRRQQRQHHRTGVPGDITIPLGLRSQAVGTGLNPKLKFGPTRRPGLRRRAGRQPRPDPVDERSARACRPARRHRPALHDLDHDLRLARQRAPRLDHLHARRQRRDAGADRPAAGSPPRPALAGPGRRTPSGATLHAVAARAGSLRVSFQDGTTFDAINPG